MTLTKALAQAQQENTDLVEIVPNANPPVCKLIDFKRFLYMEDKKEAKERKKTRRTEQKEIWLAPFIAENDLNHHLKRAAKFLSEGNKLKIIVKFKGREIGKKDFGFRILEKVFAQLDSLGQVVSQPKFLGNRIETVLSPSVKVPKTEPEETQTNAKT